MAVKGQWVPPAQAGLQTSQPQSSAKSNKPEPANIAATEHVNARWLISPVKQRGITGSPQQVQQLPEQQRQEQQQQREQVAAAATRTSRIGVQPAPEKREQKRAFAKEHGAAATRATACCSTAFANKCRPQNM